LREIEMLTAAVVGESALYRAALVSLLSKMGFDQVDEGLSVKELMGQNANAAGPDIVLVYLAGGPQSKANGVGGNQESEYDYVMAVMEEARSWNPSVNVVFLAKDLEFELLVSCFSAGASGLLLENISRSAFEESLRLVRTGEKVFPSKLAAMIPELMSRLSAPRESASDLGDYRLSDREIDILRCLTNGQANKVIAKNLDIAESTVKVHVKRILQKIHATNRTQAALWGVARGMSQRPPCDGSER
jgi:two-component system, NarL family, nitrate/nitrite response regulator NarL